MLSCSPRGKAPYLGQEYVKNVSENEKNIPQNCMNIFFFGPGQMLSVSPWLSYALEGRVYLAMGRNLPQERPGLCRLWGKHAVSTTLAGPNSRAPLPCPEESVHSNSPALLAGPRIMWDTWGHGGHIGSALPSCLSVPGVLPAPAPRAGGQRGAPHRTPPGPGPVIRNRRPRGGPDRGRVRSGGRPRPTSAGAGADGPGGLGIAAQAPPRRLRPARRTSTSLRKPPLLLTP